MAKDVPDSDRRVLLTLARASIAAHLKGGPAPTRPPEGSPLLDEPWGAFVTLHKRGALRGCIGHMRAVDPAWQTVRDVAISAAVRDPRFSPLQERELQDIDLEISLLSPLEPCPGVDHIEIGRHGLYLTAEGRSGVLLPQVPVDWGWDVPTYLVHLCQKAGLPPGAHEQPGAQLLWFTATVFGEEAPPAKR